MPQISAKRVMSGTWGQVWVGGDMWAEVSAFQAKYTYSKEEVQMAGQMEVDAKVVNVKGTGSMTIKKVYSRLAGHGDKVLQGIDERATLIVKLADPDAFGVERITLHDVSFDEEPLMDWTVGKTTEVTIPFTFTRREWLDKVSA